MENKTAALLLCPGIVYQSTQALELTRGQKVLTISCLDTLQICEWKAIGSHLHVMPQEGLTILVKGVTFSSSTKSSIIIEVDSITFMSLTFIDCTWKVCYYIGENSGLIGIRRSLLDFVLTYLLPLRRIQKNNGKATIEISTTADGNVGRHLKDHTKESGAQVNITGAVFESNTATDSIIFNALSNLFVEGATFSKNSIENAIIFAQSGTIVISNSQLKDSTVNSGALFVSEVAKLKPTNLCGTNLELGTLQCNGTWFAVSDAKACAGGNKASCKSKCEQLASCSSATIANKCYSTWKGLTEALTNSSEGTFEVCAGAMLEVINPIEVTPSSVMVVKCGFNGTGLSSCIVNGGEQHFRIRNPTSAIHFQGITFSNSSNTSIHIEFNPLQKAEVTYEGCSWLVR